MQPQAVGAPQVGVVVVNWNGVVQSRRCLLSLRDLEYQNVKVCLVDNGSIDGSAAQLAGEFPKVNVLALPSNVGYAGACNAGIAWAKERGADYVWLLNNDTTFDSKSLSALVTRAEELRGSGITGILAPKILYSSAPTTVWSAGGSLRWPWLEREHIGMGEDDHLHDDGQQTAWASGCALFFPASVADAVGPLDERYFLYLEDVDWCLRARRLNIPVWFVPEARLWHDVSLSTKEVDSRDLRYYFARNYYMLAFDHCGPVGRAWVAGRIVVTLAKAAVRSMLFPSYRRDPLYHAQTRAIRDFLGRRFGKAPYSAEATTGAGRPKTKELVS